MKRWISSCMVLAMIAAGTDSLYIETKADSEEVRILFTHDLCDHIEEVKTLDEENAVVYSGGYEYLAMALDEYRTEQTILLDAGNFSAGTMYASLNSTKAPDLTLMSRMGYDAVGVGLVDFTYGSRNGQHRRVISGCPKNRLPPFGFRNLSNLVDLIMLVCSNIVIPLPNRACMGRTAA